MNSAPCFYVEHLPLPRKAYVVEKKNTPDKYLRNPSEKKGESGVFTEVTGRKRRRAEAREPFASPFVYGTRS